MNTIAAINANQATLGYSTQAIIRDFTGIVPQGNFVGVFGPNGAGKTTLLRSLLGLIKPLSGQLMVLGEPAKAQRAAIGYVPQSLPGLPAIISGYALLCASIRGNTWGLPLLSRVERATINRMIAVVNAQHYAHRPFRQLSGGEQQRLLLAQALLGTPHILLLDEPLSHLDPRHQHHFIELIEQIRQQFNVTILLTAHDLNPLAQIMTQVLYVARGKAMLGSPKEIITNEVLSTLYETPIEVVHHQERIFVIHKNTGQIEHEVCH